MAIPKTLIQGKVLLPTGLPPASGSLTIRLSVAASALDGAANHRVAPPAVRVTLGADGALPSGFGLCPNDAIVPTPTHYRVHFDLRDAGGNKSEWEERWQVTTAPSPIDIGAVARLDLVAGAALAVSYASTQAQADAASASAGQAAISATAAQTSQTAAAGSQTAAAGSQVAAATSATAASASAAAALVSESAASGSATTASTQAAAAQTARTGADTARTAAETASTTAAGHASSAGTSATNAAGSASAADSSATAASSSSTAASASASAASVSATAASGFASSASGSATTAAGHAAVADAARVAAETAQTAAAGSASTASTAATNAGSSASAAAGSATSAAGSAATAAGHASDAGTSATAAGASATSASGSATAAAGSATSASSSASSASTSATTASGHASAAQTARTGAETAQTAAAGSASAAATSATGAAASATAADGSATAAAGSATTAGGHATSASTSATSAASSATSAASNAALLSDSMANVALSSSRTNNLATQDASILRSLWDRRAGVLSRVKISDLPAGPLATALVGTLGEPLPYVFSRAGTGHVRVDGALINVTNNVPRIEQTPRGIGIMPVDTNLLTYSNDPTQWSISGATLSKPGNVAAPDGSQTAIVAAETATTGNHWFWPPTAGVTVGALHPYSVYVKAGTRTKVGIRDSGSQNIASYDLVAGTVLSQTGQTGITTGIYACGGGWWRIWMRSQRSSSPSAMVVMLLDDAGSNNYTGVAGSPAAYFWNLQVGPATAQVGPVMESTDAVPSIVAAESFTLESKLTGAHRSWCRSITATPRGSWSDVQQIWSVGSGANSASLAVTGGNLVFTVTDSTGTAKTVTYAATSLAAGTHTFKTSVRDGTLALYVDGISVGSAGGAGTGLFTSVSPIVYIGGAPGYEFGGTLSDYVESDNSVATNCPPPEPSAVTSSASSVRALFISDTHGMASYIADAVAKGKGWAPHLLAHCGDIVWEPADDAAWATAWSPLNSVFQSSGVARGMVLGNHDVNSAGLTAAGVRAAWPADMTARLQPSVFYGSEAIAGVRFIFLDATYQSTEPATRTGMGTGTNNVGGYLPQVELDWMYALIDASTIPCVLIMHQPLLIDGGVGVVSNAATVRTALESRKAKIACVVNGHNHRPAFAALNGINYFACNAMNSPFEAITTHNLGLHQQLEVDTASRVVRFSWWENDSVKGYLEVRTVVAPY